MLQYAPLDIFLITKFAVTVDLGFLESVDQERGRLVQYIKSITWLKTVAQALGPAMSFSAQTI